jgi:hypothetical protein
MSAKKNDKTRLVEGATYLFRGDEHIATYLRCSDNSKYPATGWNLTAMTRKGRGAWLVLCRNGRLAMRPPEGESWPVGWIGELTLLRTTPRRGLFGVLIDRRDYLLEGNRYVAIFKPCQCSDPTCEVPPWTLQSPDSNLAVFEGMELARADDQELYIGGVAHGVWRPTGRCIFDLELLPEPGTTPFARNNTARMPPSS